MKSKISPQNTKILKKKPSTKPQPPTKPQGSESPKFQGEKTNLAEKLIANIVNIENSAERLPSHLSPLFLLPGGSGAKNRFRIEFYFRYGTLDTRDSRNRRDLSFCNHVRDRACICFLPLHFLSEPGQKAVAIEGNKKSVQMLPWPARGRRLNRMPSATREYEMLGARGLHENTLPLL